MTKKGEFHWRARDLISAPFIACPRCERNEFGILMISGDVCTRRCRSCLHKKGDKLPPLRKRVILLDQFAVSNLMFAIDADLPQNKRVQPYYSELFDLLGSLVKHQLIVCPVSPAHHEESMVTPHYKAMNRMSEHLGNGCSFWDAATVRRFQLSKHCLSWVRGKPEVEPRFEAQDLAHGDLHEWADLLLITVKRRLNASDVDALRHDRARSSASLNATFGRWQTEPLSFEQWFRQEMASYGPVVFREYERFYQKLGEVELGLRAPSLDECLPPEAVVLVKGMCIYLQDHGLSQPESSEAVRAYLHSDALRFVPSLRISCMLWAALARKASSGQKRPPTQGMVSDVEVASAVLPYVDAAFIDNEVRALLTEEPLRSRAGIAADLFSPNNVHAFQTYLRSIMAEAPVSHVEIARSVYGIDGLQPFREMYDPGETDEQQH